MKEAQIAGASRRVDLPLQTRAAPVVSVDPEKRTATLVWTTGATVRRMDWWTGAKYDEILLVDKKSVDLTRLNNGAPLLNAHDAWDLAGIIGVVERAWLEGGEGKAEVRFPQAGVNPDADQIFAQVQDRIIRNVSVGYAVRKYEIERNEETGQETWTAVDWQPMEISLVPVPADAGAGFRNQPHQRTFACDLIRAVPGSLQETTMTEEEKRAAEQKAADEKAAKERADAELKAREAAESAARTEADVQTREKPDAQKMIADAIANERKRSAEIHKRTKEAGLPIEVADDLIARGITVEHVGNFLLDEMAKRGTKPPNGMAAITPRGGLDAIETRRGAIAESLLNRGIPGQCPLTDRAREYRGMTLMETVRDILEAEGTRTRGMDKMEVATRAFQSTSDFPNILANIATKALQLGYAVEVRTFTPFSTERNLPDFKQVSSLQMGEGSDLEVVNESGEFKRGSIGEGAEKWNLTTLGKIFGFTRQVMINDDVGMFTRLPFNYGQAAVRAENNIVWGILTSNPNMADGNALFSSAHNNVISGGTSPLGIAGLSGLRQKARTQKGLDGKQTLNLLLKYVMVGSSLETSLEQLLSPLLYAAASANVVSPYIRSLVPIVEPRIDTVSSTAWFAAADPAQMSTIEYGYLDGQSGVYLETRMGFNVDGVEMKVRHDFGAKAVNWRGLYKSAGV